MEEHDRLLKQYTERFGSIRGVSTMFITGKNAGHLVDALRGALAAGIPLTHTQEAEVERKTFRQFYEARAAGRRVLL